MRERVHGRLVSGSWTPQCLLGSNTLPESLFCDLEGVLVPFWCFLSKGEADDTSRVPDRCEGEGDGEGLRSSGEGEGVDDGRLSRGERAGLGRPSREDGDVVVERGVDGPLVPRPFVSFSLDRWEDGGVRDRGLREEGEEEEEEEEDDDEVRRTCDAESARLRHGIFSRLTTGRDTHVLFRAPFGG